MACKDDKIRVNSYEKNVELAQLCANAEKRSYIVESKDNGKTWKFKPTHEYCQVITSKRVKKTK